MVLEQELSGVYLLVELFVGLAAVGEAAIKSGVEEDAQGPDVGRRTRVFFLRDDLRGHVARRATEYLDFAIIGNAG